MQEVDRGSRNPASHEHQKNERNWLNMYRKIKSAADVVRVRYGMQRGSGRHRFEHGADTRLKSNLTQSSVADTGIEDAGAGAIVVVPDHRRQSEVITQGIGELTPGELQIIHKVVDALEAPTESKINATDDVEQMNPGVDVIAVLANRLSSSTTDVRRNVLTRTVNTTQPQYTSLG